VVELPSYSKKKERGECGELGLGPETNLEGGGDGRDFSESCVRKWGVGCAFL
jgi:hypothetical protein